MATRYGQRRKPTYVTEAKLRKALAVLSHLPDGVTKPYRPKPANFREVYIEIGWDGLEEYFNTNWRVVRRWIEMEGRDSLRRARAEAVEAKRAGRRLTAVKRRVCD